MAESRVDGGGDGDVQVWEIASVQCVQMLEGHTNVVMDLLCWDSFLLSCSLDGTVKASVKAGKA